MAFIFKAPEPFTPFLSRHLDIGPKLFLGGSIEQGAAIDWQKVVEDRFIDNDRVVIFNPRRDNWDANLPQDPTPGTEFHTQVMWELHTQEISDIVIYNFEPGTNSPITLLELGLFRNAPKVFVRCSPDFWRYGNVRIVCDRYDIPCYAFLDDLLEDVVNEVKSFQSKRL